MFDLLSKYKYELTSLGVVTFGMYLLKLRRAKNTFNVVHSIKQRLDGKIVVITGANTGIGYETALELANRGALVVLGGRDEQKSTRAVESIKRLTSNQNVYFELLDLASLDSVKSFSERLNSKYSTIDILINNAGVMACPKWTTKHNFEYQFQVNYLSHYLLTRLLLDKICQSQSTQSARIINLTSKLYETGKIHWDDLNLDTNYQPIEGYKQSKLCNILFTNYLRRYLKETRPASHVQVFAVSPGVVLTELGRHVLNKSVLMKLLSLVFYPLMWIFMKSPIQGCECTVYCAIASDLSPNEGKYFRNCQEVPLLEHANRSVDAERLWKLSEDLVKQWLN